MLIFWDKNIVFLANPKAGSTAIEAALEPLSNLAVLRPPELKHTNFEGYGRFVAPWLASITGRKFTTVAVMREPVEWLRSWYRFRIRDDIEDPLHEMSGVTFQDFVHAYMAPDQRVLRHIGTQSGFLTHGGRTIDRLFKYEEMEALTEFMEEQLDCVILLPRVNVPPSADVSLEPALEAQLRDFMAADVALYELITDDKRMISQELLCR